MKIVTVTGDINPEDIGITMTHEHPLINMMTWFITPNEESKKWMVKSKVKMEMLSDLRIHPSICMDNLILDDVDLMVDEVSLYKDAGGSTLVSCSVDGLGRDPLGTQAISMRTGVNILISTGFYVQNSHPKHVKEMDSEQLADLMVKELTEGIDDTGIKAGLIGEIGCTQPSPWHPEEKKVVEAAGKAQSQVGCAVTIHPALMDEKVKLPSRAAETYLDSLEREGANLEKFYLSHSQFTHFDPEYHTKLIDRGITLNWDTFGMFDGPWRFTDYSMEVSTADLSKHYYHDPSYIHPNDDEMVKAITRLCENGYDKNIMLSQDICFKHMLKQYGGYGYSHVIENIVPELRRHNVGEKQIRNMLIENPKNMLSI